VRALVRLALFVGLASLVFALLRRLREARADAAGLAMVEPPAWPPFAAEPGDGPAADPAPRAPQPTSSAPAAPVAPEPGPVVAWVGPVDGECPADHPIKVKLASGIYHLPGMMNYARTVPDRCYASAAGAEADGFRPAKR
jgi:hypothetical protein